MKTSQTNSSLLTASKSIRQLILDTGLPLNKAPKALGMTSAHFMSWWSSKDQAVESRLNLTQLSQYLGISEDQIVSRTYDHDLVRTRIFDNPLKLPEKYSMNQFSFIRTSAHIFKYLKLTRGQHFADQIALKLNVSPLLYQNLSNRISLNYFLDLLDILEQKGFSKHELDTLSGVLFLGLTESDLYAEFKKSKNYYDCYNTLAKNLKLFDQNFEYRSDLDENQYRMTTFLPFENHNHFQWEDSKMKKLQRYRQLLLGWFPYLCGLAPLIPKARYEYKSDGIETHYVINFPKEGLMPLSMP